MSVIKRGCVDFAKELERCRIYPTNQLNEGKINREFTPQNSIKQRSVFGDWKVSKSGDMSYKKGIYNIYDYQLTQNDWIVHMLEKEWVNWNDFMPAYFQACKNAGIQNKTELVFY
jgi:hypothetical protein